jgi:hypothetical protein
MAMSRTAFAKSLEEGLNTIFGLEEKRYPEEWRQIYEIESSVKAQEEDVLEIGLGGAQVKQEGQDVPEDEGGQSYSAVYVHETIALMFELTEELIEDNLYTRMAPKYTKQLAKAFRHTKEIKGAATLNNATATTGGDGVPLLSTAHPIWSGGTQSNRLATDTDISEAGIEEMLIQIRKAEDDRGIPQAFKATRLIIPVDQEYNATRICKSVLRVGTANNDINAHKAMGVFSTEPAAMTYLTDTNAWFIQTDCNDGLKHFSRISLQPSMQRHFKTGNYCYKGRERYSNGYSNWRGLYGTSGSS